MGETNWDSSRDNREDFSRVDGLAFGHKQLFDRARLGGLHFVLHLHRFHNNQSLPCFNFIARFHKDSNHFSRHRRNYRLSAFALQRGTAVPTPLPGVKDFDRYLASPNVNAQSGAPRLDTDFKRLPAHQNGVDPAGNFDDIGIHTAAIELAAKLIPDARELHKPDRSADLDFEFHCTPLKCRRTPRR